MKQRLKAVQLCFWVVLLFAFFAVRSSAQFCPTTKVCVLTWQQDTGTDIGAGYSYRTGENLKESTMTAESFPGNFGQLCSAQLDGQVYAQPLIVANVTIHGYTGPVAYVVTENDTVYAIQATPPTSGNQCHVVWSVSLLLNNLQGQPTMTAATCHDIGSGCLTIYSQVGSSARRLSTLTATASGRCTLWLKPSPTIVRREHTRFITSFMRST